MVNSIGARIESGDPDGDQFAFPPSQRPREMHQRAIQLIVVPHHRRMHGVHLDDVIGIRDAFGWRQFLSRYIAYECHWARKCRLHARVRLRQAVAR